MLRKIGEIVNGSISPVNWPIRKLGDWVIAAIIGFESLNHEITQRLNFSKELHAEE
jgi:hypothetical protein